MLKDTFHFICNSMSYRDRNPYFGLFDIDILKQKYIFNHSVEHGRDITKSGLRNLAATGFGLRMIIVNKNA